MDISRFTRRDLLRLSLLASLSATTPAFAASAEGSRKKGLCITVKQNSWAEKLRKLNCKWFYSWGSNIPEGIPEGVDFTPMIYGYWGGKEGLAKAGERAKEAGIKELLGFNEPDKKNQSNMSVEKALKVWPLLMDTGLRLGSPACTHPDDEWMKAFMDGVKKRGLRVDFVTVHSYGGPNADQFAKRLAHINKMYGKPLWITEFAVGDWDAKSPQANKHKPGEVLKFMQQILPRLDKMDFVEKYAWFPAGQNSNALGTSALYDNKGNLTRLGECYRDF
ncbi:MAG: glycosyl hydrolase [Luteolibacter sp.]